ncbi:hypothetical protein T484DRAFT_1763631 [Baffinella frigidus]|nr:hypothetical protein T484DRAFT_1763631 [Cryptophyta sp. CCMP2293]
MIRPRSLLGLVHHANQRAALLPSQQHACMATSVEMVKFARADGTEVPAYSSAKGPKNGLVVIQIKATAGNMADKCGVQVCVPDLYRSKVAYEAAEANHLLSELDWPGAMQDAKASAAYLKSQGCEKVLPKASVAG